jgi:hypothetical protein
MTYDAVQKQWRPEVNEFMRTSRDHIYVAGDSSGIGGAKMAEVEGRIAAVHMAAELGLLRHPPTDWQRRYEVLDQERRRLKGYSSILNQVFAPPKGLYSLMEDETVVCRCEGVTVAEIKSGLAMGYRQIDEMKRTRFGMGFCQARGCEATVVQLMIQHGIPVEEVEHLNLRPPLSPLPLAVFEAWAQRKDNTSPVGSNSDS